MEDRWFDSLSVISDLLVCRGVKHVFIKNLVDPFKMGDIDVLIPDRSDILVASRLLEGKGFERASAGRISPPLKRCFAKNGMVAEFYPQAAWKRTIVADAHEIIRHKVMGKLGEVECYIPRPEDDFYLIATHAFSHMRVERVEVENATHLTQNDFDWMRVRDTAALFGTHVSVYFFLKTLNHLDSLYLLITFSAYNKPKKTNSMTIILKIHTQFSP